MASPWDIQQYAVSGWMIVGLVILPFLFGMLYGMRVSYKRFMVKLVKIVTPEQLDKLLDKKNKEGDTDKNRRPHPFAP